jgi:hypothetical protein
LSPGLVFRVSAPDRDINNMVLRCFLKTDGSLATGELTFSATQDLYGLGATAFIGAPPNEHVPADHTPHAAAAQLVFEAPYQMLAAQLAAADLAAVSDTSGYLVTAGVRPAGFSLNYAVASKLPSETDFVGRGVGTWSPSGATTAAIGAADTAVTLTGVTDLDQVRAGSAALLDAEIVRVVGVDTTTGIITIARGCVDTLPAAHATGTRMYFVDPFRGSDRREYITGEAVSAKLLTHTPSGDLSVDDAPTSTVTMNQRQARPYPPAGMKINGTAAPASITAPLTVTFARRNRVTQADQLVDGSAGDITPESGQTTTLQVFDSGDNKVHEETGITGTASTPWSPGTSGTYTVKLFSVRDGLASWQSAQWVGTIS